MNPKIRFTISLNSSVALRIRHVFQVIPAERAAACKSGIRKIVLRDAPSEDKAGKRSTTCFVNF